MDPITDKINELRNKGINLGWAVMAPETLPDGGKMLLLPQIIGCIFQMPNSEFAVLVQGNILAYYTLNGGVTGSLGYPVSDEMDWGNNGTRMSLFQYGAIKWTNVEGCRVYNNFLPHYLVGCMGAAQALLEMPMRDSFAKVHSEEGVAQGVNWCGYALFNMMKTGGLEAVLKLYFPSTQGLLDYGSYYSLDIYGQQRQRARISTVADTGMDIRAYHESRNSLRMVQMWDQLQNESIQPDILPGDIVLLDHNKGGGPDHIQIVRSWHPHERVLTVIDGNSDGFVLRSVLQQQYQTDDLVEGRHYQPVTNQTEPGKPVSKLQKQTYLKNLENLDVLLPIGDFSHISVGCHVLTAAKQVNPPQPASQNPHSRVFAIIRPSIADFEPHEYKNL